MQADVLAQTAPWPIPMGAKITQQQKVGYQQIAFSWREQGWLYEARWHSRMPKARIVKYDSWVLTRIRPGVGFGAGARPKLEGVFASGHWLAARHLRYAASLSFKNKASSDQLKLIKACHHHCLLSF